ncbi:MAG: hypothetical protein M4D80_11670 [Myxococcota bacterium]|nr:hypothetical protein [Myxococcota bacterium]
MYRDDSTLLDEHDRAVGAIQIADGLIVDCLSASKQLTSIEHRWGAVRKIHDDYGEVWRQLDCARQLLAARGANTMGFDELRENVLPLLTLREDGIDTTPLEDARRAVAELRLAMPGADWKGIEARTRGLVSTSFARRGQHLAFAGVAVVFSLAVVTWAMSAQAEKRVDPRIQERAEARVALNKELAVVVEDRRDRIGTLELLIGGRCDRERVTEYVKLLVMEGRFDQAYGYGLDFKARCGEDPEVQKWSRMAKKKLDRLSKL